VRESLRRTACLRASLIFRYAFGGGDVQRRSAAQVEQPLEGDAFASNLKLNSGLSPRLGDVVVTPWELKIKFNSLTNEI
jgi:hypothetical protein